MGSEISLVFIGAFIFTWPFARLHCHGRHGDEIYTGTRKQYVMIHIKYFVGIAIVASFLTTIPIKVSQYIKGHYALMVGEIDYMYVGSGKEDDKDRTDNYFTQIYRARKKETDSEDFVKRTVKYDLDSQVDITRAFDLGNIVIKREAYGHYDVFAKKGVIAKVTIKRGWFLNELRIRWNHEELDKHLKEEFKR